MLGLSNMTLHLRSLTEDSVDDGWPLWLKIVLALVAFIMFVSALRTCRRSRRDLDEINGALERLQSASGVPAHSVNFRRLEDQIRNLQIRPPISAVQIWVCDYATPIRWRRSALMSGPESRSALVFVYSAPRHYRKTL